MHHGEGTGVREQLLVRRERVEEQLPSDREHARDAHVRQSVIHVTAAALGLDEPVTPQDGEVLGEVRGLELGVAKEVGHAQLSGGPARAVDDRVVDAAALGGRVALSYGVVVSFREQFEDADAERMSEALEEIRLDLVEGALRIY